MDTEESEKPIFRFLPRSLIRINLAGELGSLGTILLARFPILRYIYNKNQSSEQIGRVRSFTNGMNITIHSPGRRPSAIVKLVIFFGILIIATGCWACSQAVVPFHLEGRSAQFKAPGKLLLFTGAMLVIMGFVTILEASRFIRVAIISLLRGLSIVIIIETIAGSTAYAYDTVISLGSLNNTLLRDLEEEFLQNSRITYAWNKLQRRYYCCGVSGPEDWMKSYWWNNTKSNLYNFPESCCPPEMVCEQEIKSTLQGCGSMATHALHVRFGQIYRCSFISVLVHVIFFHALAFLDRKI